MMKFVAIAIVLCLGLASVQAAIPEHLITSLPGFSGTFPSKQYSGYINVNKTNNRNLHYWFVESENDPANDPVVLWMNGGPGCSSLDGYFYEQGPLHFVAQPPPPMDGSSPADDVPALELNPFRWNKIANMIFLEAPAGVGFSYSDNAFDYFTDDTKTANDNHQFLINFFKAYPEYSKNRFFVSGESYAGVYVPTLVDTIRRHNATNGINLEGFLVGNGCIGTDVGNCSPQGTEFEVDFLHGHALFSDKLYKSIQQQCPDYSNPSNTCYSLLNEMSAQVGGVNVYDVYADCINGGMPVSAEDVAKYMIPLNSRQNRVNHDPHRLAANVGGPVECIDGIYAAKYLNNPEVQKAIHVRTDLGTWTVCSGKLEYNRNTKSLLPIYPTLIQTYRTLIYNGDVDAAVPYPGDEWWTSSFGFEIDNDWHEWDVNNQVAGYATSYNVNGFQFITVKGAGHMVPEYKPEQAFVMFQKFLNNSPF